MRYIKLEDLQKFPIRKDHYDKENGNEHFIYGIETVLEYAENLPTEDVVPRSEYDNLKEELDRSDEALVILDKAHNKLFTDTFRIEAEAKQEVAKLIIQEMQGRLNKLMYLEAPRHIQIEYYLKVQSELDEVKKKYIGD